MLWFSGVVLGVILGMVSCDMECFEKTSTFCQLDWYFKHGANEQSFCKMHPAMSKCGVDAAKECSTGFEAEAEKAWKEVTDLCTEGTKYNDALKNDKVCSLETFEQSNECTTGLNDDLNKPENEDLSYRDRMKIMCKWTDHIKECMFKKFDVCNTDTKQAFVSVYEAAGVIQKKICEAFGVSKKRSSEKSLYSPLFLPMF